MDLVRDVIPRPLHQPGDVVAPAAVELTDRADGPPFLSW